MGGWDILRIVRIILLLMCVGLYVYRIRKHGSRWYHFVGVFIYSFSALWFNVVVGIGHLIDKQLVDPITLNRWSTINQTHILVVLVIWSISEITRIRMEREIWIGKV